MWVETEVFGEEEVCIDAEELGEEVVFVVDFWEVWMVGAATQKLTVELGLISDCAQRRPLRQ